MPQKLPVVAAIPNYNMGEQLSSLLPQLTKQNYAGIYVLDDASTDNSRQVVEDFDNGVHFIASPENRGAGPTRNMIIPKLGHKAIIHFIDADTDLLTERMPEVANDVMPSKLVGFIGGLALTPKNEQTVWNYGPRQNIHGDAGAVVMNIVDGLMEKRELGKAEKLRNKFDKLLANWPNPFAIPTRRQIFWNIEQNLLIPSDVFEAVGGFDDKMREHEIQDLAIRMSQKGLPRYFDPAFGVKHKAVDVRNYNRKAAQLKAELGIHRKYGFRNWVHPKGLSDSEI